MTDPGRLSSSSASINLSGDESEVVAGPSVLPQMHREHTEFARIVRSRGKSMPRATAMPPDPFADKPFETLEGSSPSHSEPLEEVFSEIGRTLPTKPTSITTSTKGKQRRKESLPSLDAERGTRTTADETSASDSDQPSRHSIQHTGAQFAASPRLRKKPRLEVRYHDDTYLNRSDQREEHHCKCCRSRTEEPVVDAVNDAESTTAAATLVNIPRTTHKTTVSLVVLATLFVAVVVGSACGIAHTHGDNPRAAKGIYLAGIVIDAGIASLITGHLTHPSLQCLLPFCAIVSLGTLFRQDLDTFIGSAPLGS